MKKINPLFLALSLIIFVNYNIWGQYQGENVEYNPALKRCIFCSGKGICPDCSGLGNITCPKCQGSGHTDKICSICKGLGYLIKDGQQVECWNCHYKKYEPCSRCNGKGYWVCGTCNGTGKCPKCNGTGTQQGAQLYAETEQFRKWITNPLLSCNGTKFGVGALDMDLEIAWRSVPIILNNMPNFTTKPLFENTAYTGIDEGIGATYRAEWWVYRNEYFGGCLLGNFNWYPDLGIVGYNTYLMNYEYGTQLYLGTRKWKVLLDYSYIQQDLLVSGDLGATATALTGLTTSIDVITSGQANYQIHRKGLGLKFDFTNYDDFSQKSADIDERFISLELLWDRPNFMPSNYSAVQIGRLHVRDFIDLYFEYSHNYFAGGNNTNNLPWSSPTNQDYWYAAIGKTWRIQYFYTKSTN